MKYIHAVIFVNKLFDIRKKLRLGEVNVPEIAFYA